MIQWPGPRPKAPPLIHPLPLTDDRAKLLPCVVQRPGCSGLVRVFWYVQPESVQCGNCWLHPDNWQSETGKGGAAA